MIPPEVENVYLTTLLENAAICANRFHQFSFYFLGFSAIGYFLSKAPSMTLTVLGESMPISRAILVGGTPLVLAVIFYAMSCFLCLEDQYNREVRRLLGTADTKGNFLSALQLKLLENPVPYNYHELRGIAGSSAFFRGTGAVAYAAAAIILMVTPLGIVGYFVVVAFRTFGASWMLVAEAVAVFLCVFSLLQVFESFNTDDDATP